MNACSGIERSSGQISMQQLLLQGVRRLLMVNMRGRVRARPGYDQPWPVGFLHLNFGL